MKKGVARRVGLVVAAVVGLAIGSAAPAVSGAEATRVAVADQASCKPGLRKIDGAQVQVYCGPAKATVRFRGTTVRFANGMCVRATKAWAINVGKATIPPAKPRFSYFGITMGKLRGDRTYRKASVGFQWRGKSYTVVSNAVTMRGKGTRGTFTGRLGDPGGPKVSGSFTC